MSGQSPYLSLRLVNGYVCRNCTDEDLAKKGIDPEHPKRKLAENGKVDPADAKHLGDPQKTPTNVELGQNRPETSGNLGRSLNVFA